jgi:hypothetical protein
MSRVVDLFKVKKNADKLFIIKLSIKKSGFK